VVHLGPACEGGRAYLGPGWNTRLSSGPQPHDGPEGKGDIHCHICHELWAARVDEKNECPRCALRSEERTDKGIP
jgi:uncharacterized paraquat-inducible protein A